MPSNLEEIRQKVELNEYRARDAEARLRIIEAELAILEKRKLLDAAQLNAPGATPSDLTKPVRSVR
ncbi:MAG: hypothetical protein AAGF45_08765 [Pseudomonadota bacterium]